MNQRFHVGIVCKGLIKQREKRSLEADYRVNEAQMSIIINKHVIAILSNIRHQYIIVSKRIAIYGFQFDIGKTFRYLNIIRSSVGANCGLLIDYTCFLAVFSDAKELKCAIREQDIMNHMFKKHILRRMPFEMQFCKRILDFVINLFCLCHSDRTFTGADCILRSWHIFSRDKASRILGCKNQHLALSEYRIRRHLPKISASFIGAFCRKHSNIADIKNGSLSDGLERIYDSIVVSIPSKRMSFSSACISSSFQEFDQCFHEFQRRTSSLNHAPYYIKFVPCTFFRCEGTFSRISGKGQRMYPICVIDTYYVRCRRSARPARPTSRSTPAVGSGTAVVKLPSFAKMNGSRVETPSEMPETT